MKRKQFRSTPPLVPTPPRRQARATVRILAIGLLICILPCSVAWANFGKLSLDETQADFIGEGDNEQTGWAVAFAGDFNGDGFGDILLGAQLNNQAGEGAGKAYLVFGSASRFGGRFDLVDADGLFSGEEDEDYAGSSLSRAGDVDGDGYDDFLVGAWGNDEAGGAAGKVYLIFGGPEPPGAVQLEDATSSFVGEQAGDAAGYTLAAGGDLNGDGYDDFLIGAPNNDSAGNNAGRVYIFFGKPNRSAETLSLKTADVILEGDAPNDLFGHAMSAGPDFDQDGRSDLLVGAYGADTMGQNAGAVYLFPGADLEPGIHRADAAFVIIYGNSSGDQLGYSVALSNDLNGDGTCDLVLGSNRATVEATWDGMATILPGTMLESPGVLTNSYGPQFYGDSSNDGAGYRVGANADFDLDGVMDFLVAAPFADSAGEEGVGIVGVVFGAADLESASLTEGGNVFLGTAGAGLAGFALDTGGDVDGDGHADILIGAAGIGHAYLVLTGYYFDDDQDGLTELEGDCDDRSDLVGPDQPEIPYDGVDQDCDGVDQNDLDQDGFVGAEAGGPDCNDGDPEISPAAVETPDGIDQNCNQLIDDGTPIGDADQDGFSPLDGDCDDSNADVHPGADEHANGADDDCDGAVDEDLPTTDDDGDGLSEVDGDCDDNNPAIYPGSTAVVDEEDSDCSGGTDLELPVGDSDGDGFTIADGDPDDENPQVYPGATELPDGIDNDGDGSIDEGTEDMDMDGFSPAQGDNDDSNPSVYPGAQELIDGVDNNGDGVVDEPQDDLDNDGVTREQGDCDDSDPTTFPGAPELPDGADNNCNGKVDDTLTTYDDDGDGFSEAEGDCNDGDPSIHPNAQEIEGGIDEDCDGLIDEGTAQFDSDSDGFTPDQGDCADGDPDSYPGAIEVIDGRDNDCDGKIDDETEVFDDDGDGFAEADDDCEDSDPTRYPGASELCDHIDNNCNDQVDEGCPPEEGDDDASEDTPAETGDDDETGRTPRPGDDDDDTEDTPVGTGDDDAAEGTPHPGDDETPPESDDDASPTPSPGSWAGSDGSDDTGDLGNPLTRAASCSCAQDTGGGANSLGLLLTANVCWLCLKRLRRRKTLRRSPTR